MNDYPLEKMRPDEYGHLKSPSAERKALYSIIDGGEEVREAAKERLHPDMFTSYRSIALSVFTPLEQGKTPDVDTLGRFGASAEEIAKVTQLQYTPANAIQEEGAFEEVETAYRGRQLLESITERKRDILEEADPKEVQISLERDLQALGQSLQKGQMRPSSDFTSEGLEKLFAGKNPSSAASTGLPAINSIAGAIMPEDLWIVGGRPAMGKTSLCLTWVLHQIKQGQPVAYFSIEGSGESLVSRLVQMEATVEQKPTSDEEQSRAIEAANLIHDAPLWIDESPRLDVPTLGSRIRRLRAEEDLSVAYVDFLQLMRPDPTQSHDKKSDRIASTVRDLKLLARDSGVPIVLISQLNRGVERRTPPEPRLSDLREAGEEFADKVLLCYRPEYYDIRLPSGDDGHNYGVVTIAKHKDGPTGDAELAFVKKYSLWAPLDKRSIDYEPSQNVPFSG